MLEKCFGSSKFCKNLLPAHLLDISLNNDFTTPSIVSPILFKFETRPVSLL